MLTKLKRRIDRWRFKISVKKLRKTEFCIIANNCFGSRIYKTVRREYNTPFIGLFLMPECFTKLVNNFEEYMSKDICFIKKSKYAPHNEPGRGADQYPLGLLGDLELHFVHYKNEQACLESWERRKARIDHKQLYFILIANGPCDKQMMAQFAGHDPSNKVCFHRQEKLNMPACVYIPSETEDMGNLYSQYHRFTGRFDFSRWIMSNR